MERLKQIDQQIKTLEEGLSAVKGRETEVYTRIVGYYRAVKNWNKGKREEYNHRICFTSLEHKGQAKKEEQGAVIDSSKVISFEKENRESISGYSYFYRKTCPNCPSVKKYIDKLEMAGEFIDVDTPEGIISAKELQVLTVPTVIFSNKQGKEVIRARNVQEIKDSLPSVLVAV